MYSTSEENYLKAIYKLSKGSTRSVNTNSIAEHLQTSPASVSDMLKKLAIKEIILYEKYKGVTLSETGQKVALKLVRRHRLWETFLVQTLKFNWDEVHDLAEDLEHINSDLLVNRLDQFLNFPQIDPHGDPIPAEDGSIRQQNLQVLSLVPIGNSGVVSGLKSSAPLFLQYLDKAGISIGAKVKVKDKIEFDNSLEISINNVNTILVSKEVSANILVTTN